MHKPYDADANTSGERLEDLQSKIVSLWPAGKLCTDIFFCILNIDTEPSEQQQCTRFIKSEIRSEESIDIEVGTTDEALLLLPNRIELMPPVVTFTVSIGFFCEAFHTLKVPAQHTRDNK